MEIIAKFTNKIKDLIHVLSFEHKWNTHFFKVYPGLKPTLINDFITTEEFDVVLQDIRHADISFAVAAKVTPKAWAKALNTMSEADLDTYATSLKTELNLLANKKTVKKSVPKAAPKKAVTKAKTSTRK